MKVRKALRVFSKAFKRKPEIVAQMLQEIWAFEHHEYDIHFDVVQREPQGKIGFQGGTNGTKVHTEGVQTDSLP